MELKIRELAIPQSIEWNYEEIKSELLESVKKYETLVYTDDEVKQAKADRASLNKLKQALNDERIRREREYMEPFNTFKAQVNEIIEIIAKPIAVIDKQVKEVEEKKKAEKREAIDELWKTIAKPEWLNLPQVFDEKWLNASKSMSSITDEMKTAIAKASNEMATLETLGEFAFEAMEIYKSTLDINKAIAEGHRMADIAKRKQEAEAPEAARMAPKSEERENVPSHEENASVRQWIGFRAYLSIEEATALKAFFEEHNISFEKA